MEELRVLHHNRLLQQFDSRLKAMEQQIDRLTSEVTRLMNAAHNRLKAIAPADKSAIDPDSKIRRNIQRSVPRTCASVVS